MSDQVQHQHSPAEQRRARKSKKPSGLTQWPPGWPGDLSQCTEDLGHVPTCTEIIDCLAGTEEPINPELPFLFEKRRQLLEALEKVRDPEQRGGIKAALVWVGRRLKKHGLPPEIRRAPLR